MELQRNILLGKYIEINRLDNELTLDSLSKLAGISKGYLSEIENGKKNPKIKLVNKILDILNSDFIQDERYFVEGGERLCLAYEFYMQEDYSSLKSIFDDSDYLINTFGFSSYMLMGFMLKVISQKDISQDLNTISMIETCFNDVQNSIWLELQINISLKLFKIKQANVLLESLRKVCVPLVYPMFYLDKMIVSIHRFDRLDTIKYYQEALDSFSKECNDVKLQHLFVYKLAIYNEFNKQDEFNKLYLNLMNKAEKNNMDNLKLACLRIKIPNDIKLKKYNDIINTIEKVQKKHKSFMQSSLTYSYYRINDIKKCKKTISLIKEYGNEYDLLFSKFMEAVINGEDAIIIKEKIVDIINKNKQDELIGLLYDSSIIFTDYFLTIEDYKSIYEITKEYLMF